MTESTHDLLDALPRGGFATTRWSMVLASVDPRESGFRAAMQQLAETYHSATTSYLAAYRRTNEDAEDLAQEFFLNWLSKGMPALDPEAGSFRGYLKSALRHFVQNHARARRVRAAVLETVELTEGAAVDCGAAERAFDDSFHAELLARAVGATFEEYELEGRPAYAEAFRRYYVDVGAGGQPTYRSLAGELSVNESDVTNWLAHGRRRLRRHVTRLLRDSVADEAAFRRELEALLDERE